MILPVHEDHLATASLLYKSKFFLQRDRRNVSIQTGGVAFMTAQLIERIVQEEAHGFHGITHAPVFLKNAHSHSKSSMTTLPYKQVCPANKFTVERFNGKAQRFGRA